jgi:hypothetical protein
MGLMDKEMEKGKHSLVKLSVILCDYIIVFDIVNQIFSYNLTKTEIKSVILSNITKRQMKNYVYASESLDELHKESISNV